MYIDMIPYWFTPKGIEKIAEKYDAKYMGCWCIKRHSGEWTETPVDVFYVENPDVEAGHTNYFGMHVHLGEVYITEASSAFSADIIGVLHENEVLVSRFRHDYAEKGGCGIDGGRDYTKVIGPATMVKVKVNGPEFIFEVVSH